jgi:hypothetical protein
MFEETIEDAIEKQESGSIFRRTASRRGGPTLAVFVLLLAPQVALALSTGERSPSLRLAYIDPGTGSFVIQALVAAAAGLAVTLKIYWTRIKGFLGLAGGTKKDDPTDGGA